MEAPPACAQCQNGHAELDFSLSMAYQPIVDLTERRVMAYEALVRGPLSQPAPSILAQVNSENRYAFDQACRVKAIELASKLNLDTCLSINFLPNAIYQPETCIRTTLAACRRYGILPEQILFEITEAEKVEDPAFLTRIANYYKQIGFRTAIDDFGAGYAGLSLLANFQPDFVKLDMELVRDIHLSPAKQAIVRGMQGVCGELGIEVIVEGIETREELDWFQERAFRYFQGYLFARPGFECLPVPDFSCREPEAMIV